MKIAAGIQNIRSRMYLKTVKTMAKNVVITIYTGYGLYWYFSRVAR